ncbi:helix-turn-helix domain-containing protein [Rudaea sp.]|uniref:helix-turn-helix domain-containing protein n=1 Tax=Rudaea sp. TaxID=2136325 RepID=UPI0037831C81
MPKSIYNVQYRAMLELLKQQREASGVLQADLGKRLKIAQSSISRIESGDRRIDPIELRNYCLAIGLDFPTFVGRLEEKLALTPDVAVSRSKSR